MMKHFEQIRQLAELQQGFGTLRKILVKRAFSIGVHHGEIGVLLGLCNLFKRSRPDAAGVLSGLGETLSQDDIADKEEWFKFKKKENIPDPEKSGVETNQDNDSARRAESNAK